MTVPFFDSNENGEVLPVLPTCPRRFYEATGFQLGGLFGSFANLMMKSGDRLAVQCVETCEGPSTTQAMFAANAMRCPHPELIGRFGMPPDTLQTP